MYLTNRFYIVFVLVILFLGSGYAFAPLFVVGQWALVALIALVSADGFLLYRTNAIQAPGLEFVVPKYYVYENVGLDVSVGGDSTGLSFDYALKAGNTPLQSYCTLAIGVRHMPVADTSKYYVVQKVGKWRAPAGGTFDGGWMKTRVREFGTYAVALDTVAPRIVPVGQSGWRSSRNVRFKITDSGSGI